MPSSPSIPETNHGPPRHPDAAWWIQAGASALGERGVSAAFIEQLKRGVTTNSGVPRTDPCSDAQLGWGKRPRDSGSIRRARICGRIWSGLSRATQAVLVARYESRQWPPNVRSLLGGLAGVVVLQQGTLAAERRTAEASDRWAKAARERARLQAALAESLPPGLARARARVRRAASRALVDPQQWSAVARAAAVVAELAGPWRDLEDALMGTLLELAEAEGRAQVVLSQWDLQPVYRTCQVASRKDKAAAAALARLNAWKGPAAAAVVEAHVEWDLRNRLVVVRMQREAHR